MIFNKKVRRTEMAKSKMKNMGQDDGNWISTGCRVNTNRLGGFQFTVLRDGLGWFLQSDPIADEIDFITSLAAEDFKYEGGPYITAPDLGDELETIIRRLRSRFADADPHQQARIVGELWDYT
jgi:hypothetical protein